MLSVDTNREVQFSQQAKYRHKQRDPESDRMVAYEVVPNENAWETPATINTAVPTSQNTMTGLSRTKSLFSMNSGGSASSSTSSELSLETEYEALQVCLLECQFGADVGRCTQGNPHVPEFDSNLRKVMEPHLRKARRMREKCRNQTHLKVEPSIASSVGVPYTELRSERPFLFDEHSYPLHRILAETLQVEDLSRVHEIDEVLLLNPLLDRKRRECFHRAYDSFVTSFCIPLLHSLTISKKVFLASSLEQITYRYQAFPTIQIARPGGGASAPMCDSALGHSIGCLAFHIPLTPSVGSSALYVESHPGKEDWHPLSTKSFGLGYVFDGARCLSFAMENTTDKSRVSLVFRVMIYRESAGRGVVVEEERDGLCPPQLVNDRMSREVGYYDEAVINLRHAVNPGLEVVVKKNGNVLVDPDKRVGPPFV